jgi:hypothetical protein
MAGSFEEWWAKQGTVTKFTIMASVGLTVAYTFELIDARLFTVSLRRTFFGLEIWRPITACYFLGKLSFNFLIFLANLVIYTSKNEEYYLGRMGDMVWMLIVTITMLHVGAFFLDMEILSHSFIMVLLWIWCRRHEDARLSLYMFTFRATTFPWVLVAFNLIVQRDKVGSLVQDLLGIVVGHAFFFLADMLPATHNMQLVRTPQFLYRFFPNERVGAYTVHAPGQPRQANPNFPAPGQPQRHNWGQGRPLNN